MKLNIKLNRIQWATIMLYWMFSLIRSSGARAIIIFDLVRAFIVGSILGYLINYMIEGLRE
jgi:hypothetical protein